MRSRRRVSPDATRPVPGASAVRGLAVRGLAVRVLTLGVLALGAPLATPLVSPLRAQARAAGGGAAARGAADAPDASALLARARAEYASVRTARAEFVQEIRNPLLGRTLNSRGTLVQRKPGRMVVTFSDPAGDRIVSDGTHLWVYIPSSAPGQVLRMPAGDGGTGGVDLAATVLDAPREGYAITSAGARAVGNRPAHGVTLIAKPNAETPFPRATIWIDDADASVREVAITDAQGVARTIRLVSWEKNVNVDDTSFRFQVPKGVRIVEQP
jgi:outer membrane lipoprotein carrier protein